MSSEIRANTLKNRVGLSTISITDTGIVVSGVTTCSGIVQAIQFKLLDNAKAVYGNSGDMEIYHNATNSLIQNGTGSLQIITTTGSLFFRGQDNISFNTAGNNERLRITSAGRVGIGTDNPTRKLQIGGSEVDDMNVIRLGKRIACTNTNLPLIGHHSGDGTGSGLALCATSTNGAIHFFTGNGGNGFGHSSNTERVRITSAGRVGIGTDNPGGAQVRIHKDGLDQILQQWGGNQGSTAGQRFMELYSPSTDSVNDYFRFQTGNAIKFRIDSIDALCIDDGGKVGIGTDNPASTLQVVSSANNIVQIRSTNRYSTMYMIDSIGSTFMQCDSGELRLGTGGSANVSGGETEALRIKSTGEVLINESSARSYVDGAGNTQTPKLQVESDDNTSTAISLRYNSGAGAANRRASFIFARTADGTAVADNSVLGEFLFMGEGNNTLEKAASIRTEVDGTPGTNDMPGRLIFSTSADGADSPIERLRIDSSGRVMIGGATSAHGSTNRDDLVIGAVDQANQTGITIGSASASGISFADAGNDTAGGIYYSHGNDDMIFYAGGNQRGRIYDNAGITGIEHHRFIPFLIGYDVQNTTNITMSKGFGGMSQLPMNADGDKAYMSYVTHWRHREYAGVYFWYGASGNTSGATFDWDFTVWNASSGSGYSASSHTFTITSGTMSNGKMYRLNATSSWPTHAATKFVQFVIEYDELQNGTSLQLSGMELAEYTTP